MTTTNIIAIAIAIIIIIINVIVFYNLQIKIVNFFSFKFMAQFPGTWRNVNLAMFRVVQVVSIPLGQQLTAFLARPRSALGP